MKDIDKIKQHIETLRELVRAANGLNRARESNSKLVARAGVRGGRATTLHARHDIAAEYYWKVESKAEQESRELWA